MTGIIDTSAGLTSATIYFGCIPSFLFSFPAYMKNQQTKNSTEHNHIRGTEIEDANELIYHYKH